MRKITLYLLAIAALALGLHIPVAAQKVSPRAGVVRVKLQTDIAKNISKKSIKGERGKLTTEYTPINEVLRQINAVELKPAFPANPRFAQERAKYGLDQWYEVRFDENIRPEEAVRLLSETPGILKANVKKPMRLIEGDGKAIPAGAVTRAMPGRASAAMPFNDPRLPQQWHYNNTGDMQGMRAGADINLFEAWKKHTGNPNVIVAIIDGGIDYSHEDLAANMYINQAELNGQPGVDDDNNGFVDDVYGYNFCSYSHEIFPHSHGTHVAGTVGAVNNNGIGVAGVAGGNGQPGSGVSLMSCQVFDSRVGVSNPEGDFAMALLYAAENGASIAQCSWGWAEPGYYEQDVLDAVRYFSDLAYEGRSGGLCIFAPGNDGLSGDFYPACMPEVVAVTAMTADLTPAPYSNFGPWADVVAPGGFMDYNQSLGVLSTLPNNQYGYMDGTSMATPHVSGIAALVLSANPDLPMSTLRQQIETSVNDFYSLNPEAEGLFGAGYVDAAKALLLGDGSAPSAVTDFSMMVDQESISLTWIIPQSSDNNVNHHLLYYSTSPFTPTSNLASIPTKLVDTKFQNSGDEFTYELTGLQPKTTYYLALVAVNRWGNRSAMSVVKQATTNDGPKMSLDRSLLSLRISPNKPVAEASFNIVNSAEGMLRWSCTTRTESATPSILSNGAQATPIVPYTGTAAIKKAPRYSRVVTSDYATENYPKEITYADEIYAYIGESDNKLPNSMAQHFTIDAEEYPEGFNLTAVSCTSPYGQKPVVEVYSGTSMMSPATLLIKWQPSVFGTDYPLNLPEQLYFAPGESFWVAVHFDVQEELFPLTIALTECASPSAKNCYMSNDLGASWSRLNAVLAQTAYANVADKATWAIKAISNNPDWSSVLSLDPAGGIVPGNSQQEVVLTNDGQPLCNGTYALNLHFQTNESEPGTDKLPVYLVVSGHKPIIEVKKIVDFGSLLVGEKRTIEVEVFNQGYGAFAGSNTNSGAIFSDNIHSTNSAFSGPEYINSSIGARSKASFPVTFQPTSEGSFSGQIVISDVNGYQFKVMVQGAATLPAKIEVEPAVLDLGDLDPASDSIEKTFKISNTGHYPLQFAFPKFSNEQIGNATAGDVHRFGYSWLSNLNGSNSFSYEEPKEILGAVEVSQMLGDSKYFTDAIDIGFQFPYYGKTYDKLYIHSFGGVCFNRYHGGMMFSPLEPTSYGVDECGFICAFGFELAFKPTSHVRYGHQDGKFIVEYKDVLGIVYNDEYTPISFRVALSPNGNIEMYYDDYDNEKMFTKGRFLYCGIDDFGSTDPLTVTNIEYADPEWDESIVTERGSLYKYFHSGTAVQFAAPAPHLVHSVSPDHGMLSPGEVAEIKAVVKATESMNAGPTHTNLVINSNDPHNKSTLVVFNANIVGASLVPVLELGAQEIDFGSTFRTTKASRTLAIKNLGRNNLTVSSVSSQTGEFEIHFQTPAVIPAGQSKDILITMPTDTEGARSDVITVVSDGGTASASVHGVVTGCPDISLGFDKISTIIESGNSEKHLLSITNSGNEDLEYYITVADHLSYAAPTGDDVQVRYSYESCIDDGTDVKFNWVDIETNGKGEQNNFTYYMSHDYVEVDLPFEFPYYGKKYNKMYVYNSGFVSFTKRADEKIWPEPPGAFPAGTIYTNVIAPYWGLHSMDVTKTAGTFHYVSDDQAVVSWMEYGNSMNFGVDFQLILKKDGTFKFQYKALNAYAVIFNIFGVAGISDENGNGIRLPERYVQFNDAVQFHPITELKLKKAESATAQLEVLGDAMAGKYQSAINLRTNVPGKEEISLPVEITITGTPKPVIPEIVTEEHYKGFTSSDRNDWFVNNGAMYALYIPIANEGTAPFTIESIDFTTPTYKDPFFGFDLPAFLLYYPSTSTNFMTGEPELSWKQYSKNSFRPISVGANGVKLAIPMLQAEVADVPGEYICTLKLRLGSVNGSVEKTVQAKFIVTEIARLSLDKQEIKVDNALAGYEGDQSLTITNTGLHTLEYSFYLDPSGKGEQSSRAIRSSERDSRALLPAQSGDTAPIVPFEVGRSDEIYDLPAQADFQYIRGLYYPMQPSATTYYTYGASNTYTPFSTSTQFTAPADGGFNITHVYAWVNFNKYENIDLPVRIIGGDSPEGSNVLGKGTYHLGEKVDSQYPVFVIIPLDKPVYMSPGQEVCLVIDYPAGVEYPAALIYKDETVVSNRYMGYTDEYGWYDVATLFKENYGSLGYVNALLETVEGSAWSRLLTEPTHGSLAPGESAEIKVHLSADLAPLDSNKSILVIKSNDPDNSTVNFPVILNKNAAPEIRSNINNVALNEGTSTSVDIVVSDPEGDAVTVTMADNGGIASMSTPTFDPNGNTIFTVTLNARYGDAGSFSFTIDATDSHDNTASHTVNYTVAHVNRAPRSSSIPNVNISVGQASNVIDLNTYFTDPDGDELSYVLSTLSKRVTIFHTGSKVIFLGNEKGITSVNITATDPEGLSTTGKVAVLVSETGGVDDVVSDSEIDVFPNPVADVLHVSPSATSPQLSCSVYSIDGVLVAQTQAMPGAVAHIDMKHLPAGNYLLVLTDREGHANTRMIIKK